MITRCSFFRTVIFFALAGILLAMILPSSIAAQMVSAFGPKQYTRIAGPPQIFTETFEYCGTAQSQIVVINGNANEKNRISSASIFLNGIEIIAPKDFNQKVTEIVKPVILADQNQLEIRLTSKPGSFLIVSVEFAASAAVLTAGRPGASLQDATTLLSAVAIINSGTAAAQNVQLTAITLDGATLTSPASLPFNLGDIPALGSEVLNANFSGGPFTPGGSYVLTLQGTYAVDTATYCFTLTSDLIIPPSAPGSALVTKVTVEPDSVFGAPFPHLPPINYSRVNPGGPPVPTAPFVPGTPTPNMTGALMPITSTSSMALLSSPPPIVFLANNGLGLTTDVSTTAEPSGASGGGVVFATANWTAAYSTDGGSTFTQLDPTTIFPADAVGYCCDQIVQYVPSIDRFIWLLQGTGYRLAMASPADIINSNGTAWTYWNLTPGLFGSCSSFDYPDLSVGNNSLYISWDAFCSTNGFQVARTSLTGIQAGGTITIEFTDPANAPSSIVWGAHLTQNTANEIFWAGHNGNNKLRVYSLAEGSNTYFWRDIGISSWANNAPTSTTPDGQDWLCKNFHGCTGNGAFPRNGIIGATRSGNNVWFAWSAGTNDNFKQAHIEMVTLDRSNNFNKIQQVQIWNNDYAFAYPALATNACTGEVGLSFEYGGNGNYENHVVGFWGDFVAYITTGSNVGTTRYGDYATIRQTPVTKENPGNLFDAFGYGLNTVPPPGTGTLTDIHYVVFGRPASWCEGPD